MKNLKWLALALFLAAPITAPAAAAPSLGDGVATPNPNVVEVDRRCGRGRHYVRSHRGRNGRWIRGYCSRNRR
jgi:hypothetical protein